MRDSVGQPIGNVLFDPVLCLTFIRISEDRQQLSASGMQYHAVPACRLDVRYPVECGRALPHFLQTNVRYAESIAQMTHQRIRVAREPFLQLREVRHWMVPASSKTGMYISTTTPPTAMPS